MFGLVAAQKLSDSIPECAVKCLEDGVSSATNCSLDDSQCICEVQNYRDTYDAAQACVLKACGAAKSLGMYLFLLLRSSQVFAQTPFPCEALH